jgi:hypothetical protein
MQIMPIFNQRKCKTTIRKLTSNIFCYLIYMSLNKKYTIFQKIKFTSSFFRVSDCDENIYKILAQDPIQPAIFEKIQEE